MSKKILVTGAFGFIGSHLTEFLLQNNHEVIAFDRYNNNNEWGWLENSKFKNDIEFILGDIRDFDSVNNVVKRSQSIFHLAALIGIPYSYISPLAYLKTNLEGTYNILEASKLNNLEQVLITSTSEVYGTAQYIPIDENHPLQAQSPYSASKIAADHLAISYFNSFNLPVKIVRPFNNFGPRQSARAIIPTIVSQLIKNKEGNLKLGNLSPTRDFTYVTDTCEAYKEIFSNNKFIGEVTNIGNNNEISIKNLALMIAKIMNCQINFVKDDDRLRPKNSEVERLVCSNNKMLELSKWKPKLSFENNLNTTIQWYKNNSEYLKHNIYNV